MNTKTVLLYGGLGNRLWQIAFAHKLAVNFRVKIVDIHDFSLPFPSSTHKIVRNLNSVCEHDIKYEVKDSRNIFARLLYIPDSRYFKILRRKSKVLDARGMKDDELWDLNSSGYEIFLGYFQDSHYLGESIREVLNELHESLKKLEPKLGKFLARYEGFVHIRGGDYLQARNQNAFGVLSKDYYARLAGVVPGTLTDDYAIFTDDSSLVKELLPEVDLQNIFSSSDFDEEASLYLMGTAKIACVANSSFSWWGGMLARLSGSRMIAPIPWFKEDYLKMEIPRNIYEPGVEKLHSSFRD